MIDLTLSGGLYKIASCVFFALINLLLKTIDLPPSEVACFENLFAAILLWTLSCSSSFSSRNNSLFSPHKKNTTQPSSLFLDSCWKNPLYWLRAALALISSWLWVMSVQKLPLLQSVSMGFLSPFVTIIGAWFFLGEKLTFWRILAVFLAFLGGTLISFGGKIDGSSVFAFDPWVLAPLFTTVLFSATNLLSKSLLLHTPPLVLTRSLMMVTGLGCLSIGFFIDNSLWIMPSADQWWRFLALGVLAASAHMTSHLAMARSDIIALLPLGVIRLALSGVLGWVFLKETPSLWLMCGMIFIIGASFCLSWHLKWHLKK